VSAQPPAKKKAGQIEKETLKKRISNDEGRMTKEGILSILFVKRAERSDIHNSSIVNRHSMKFHTSAASDQKNGQSNQKRNFGLCYFHMTG
jgi:hypothetical protein